MRGAGGIVERSGGRLGKDQVSGGIETGTPRIEAIDELISNAGAACSAAEDDGASAEAGAGESRTESTGRGGGFD